MRSAFRIGIGIVALLLAMACACPSAPSPTPVPPTEPPAAVPTEAPPPTPEPTEPPSPLRISFIDPNYHVCTIQLDGQGLACLADSGEASSPAWSPDGQTLAFIHREDTPPAPGQVMLYDLENGTTTVLPLEITEEWILGTLGNLSWAPDGQHLLIDYSTGNVRGVHIVTVPTGQTVREMSVIGSAHWAPDGKRLAFSQRQELEVKHPDEIGDALSLAVWEIGQPEPVVVLEGTYEMSYAPQAWLPDGRILHFQYSWNAAEDMPGESSLWTINPDVAGEPQPAMDIPLGFDREAMKAELPEEFRADAWRLSLSSDERWMLFQWGSWPETGIYLVDRVEGGDPLLLVNGIDPAWQPGTN
jgi:hypothetical protein